MNEIVTEIRSNPKSLNKLYNLMYDIVGPNRYDAFKMVNYLKYKLGLSDSTIRNLVLA